MDYQNILENLKPVIKEAGQEILHYYNKEYSQAEKEDFPITEVDFASFEILKKGLDNFSDIGILAEETKEEKEYLKYDKFFIVDSLDGTKDFVHKTGDFSVMIALAENDYPILGMVYQPLQDKLFFAIKGQGAFLEMGGEKRKITVSAESDFTKMKLVTSRFHLKEYEIKLKENLQIADYEKMGSAGLKMCKIAEGEAHIYLNTVDKTGEWDTAAGAIIVEEAGGKITDIEGNKLKFGKDHPYNINGFVVSNGTRHEEIISGLQKVLEK